MKRNMIRKKILLATFALTVCNVSFVAFSMNKQGSSYQSPQDAINLKLDFEQEGVKLTSSDNTIINFMVKNKLSAPSGEEYYSARHAKGAAVNFKIIKNLLALGLPLEEIGRGEINMYFSLDEPSQFIKINKDNIVQGAKIIKMLWNLEDNYGLNHELYGPTDVIALATYYSKYLPGTPIWNRDVSQQELFLKAVRESYDHILDWGLGVGASKKLNELPDDLPEVHAFFKDNLRQCTEDFKNELQGVGFSNQ